MMGFLEGLRTMTDWEPGKTPERSFVNCSPPEI